MGMSLNSIGVAGMQCDSCWLCRTFGFGWWSQTIYDVTSYDPQSPNIHIIVRRMLQRFITSYQKSFNHLCTRQSLTLMSISSSLHMPTSVLLEANTKTFVDSVMQTVSSAKGTHGKQIKFNLPTKTHSQLASPNWKQIVWVVDRTLLATKCKIHLEIHREKKSK